MSRVFKVLLTILSIFVANVLLLKSVGSDRYESFIIQCKKSYDGVSFRHFQNREDVLCIDQPSSLSTNQIALKIKQVWNQNVKNCEKARGIEALNIYKSKNRLSQKRNYPLYPTFYKRCENN